MRKMGVLEVRPDRFGISEVAFGDGDGPLSSGHPSGCSGRAIGVPSAGTGLEGPDTSEQLV